MIQMADIRMGPAETQFAEIIWANEPIASGALSKKAEERSSQYSNSTANRILAMTPGQPIIIGHHSEKKARRLHERAWQDIGKSIEEDKKSKYYKDRKAYRYRRLLQCKP